MSALRRYAAEPRREALDVELSGFDLIREPLLNKGTGFSHEERRAFGLEGLLPHYHNTMEQQLARVYASFRDKHTPMEQYLNLAALQDRNEHLFYRLLCEHLEEVMPVIYTPTVGLATRRFSHHFRRARGVWITPDMRGRIREVLARVARARDVRLLVVTDNESILGIGDQGAGGIAICIGKLSLYCAGAGIHPAETLPVSLDVGTDNEALLEDDLYLGWPHRRLRGGEYDALVEEFVHAVAEVFPGALVQWEDFRKDNALGILDRYRDVIPSFNDDIQGTGAVAAAGVLAWLRSTGVEARAQRIVIHGAGAAGLGIARQLRVNLSELGMAPALLRTAIAVLDSRGLLVDDQRYREAYKNELAWPASAARAAGLADPADRGLARVVEALRPTVLIGTSGQAGAFDETIVRAAGRHSPRPLIMPFSNPTEYAEAIPRSVLEWTDGRAVVATGSPFPPVERDGRRHRIAQGNNVFVFPGLGLGALVAGARRVSDGMIAAAVSALADAITDAERDEGMIFPVMGRLREVSARVAAAVQARAIEDGDAPPADADTQARRLADSMWSPRYPRYVVAEDRRRR